MRRTRKGFTLVELLIVVAVLGALTAMMSLSSAGAVDAAKAARIIHGMNTVKTAVQMYVSEYSNANPAVTPSTFIVDDVMKTYFDASTWDDVKDDFTVVIGTGDETDKGWFVKYTFPSGTSNGVKTKLAGHTGDGLLKEAKIGSGGFAGAAADTDVFMRAH